jgi:ribosomal protein L23
MQFDLIKRMVVTEKYVYIEPQPIDAMTQREKVERFQKTQREAEEKEKQLQQQQTQDEQKKQQANENVQTENPIVANNELNENEIKGKEEESSSDSSSSEIEDKQSQKPLIKKDQYATYAFDLDARLTKPQIKTLLEKAFNVNIVSINTYIAPMKKKRVRFNQGYKSRYKRAIIKLKPDQRIINPLEATQGALTN